MPDEHLSTALFRETRGTGFFSLLGQIPYLLNAFIHQPYPPTAWTKLSSGSTIAKTAYTSAFKVPTRCPLKPAS
jgi:hypothetical protein